MRYNVRCRNCQARRVLHKHPTDYIHVPKCLTCGTCDKGYLIVKLTKTETCYCAGCHYPHRIRSNVCLFYNQVYAPTPFTIPTNFN